MVLPLALPPLWQLLTAATVGTAASATAVGAERRQGKPRNPLEDSPDALQVDPGEDSAFLAFLDTLGTPGRAVNNTLMGNFEGAGRNLADLGGDIVDSVLPGDWIPHISRRMDKPGFSDVAGGMDPGVEKFAVDVIGGAATDPTSFIPGAVVSKGLGAIGKVADKGVMAADKLLPGTADKVAEAGRWGRRVIGDESRFKPKTKEILATARAAKTAEAQAGMSAIKAGALKGLSEAESFIVSDVMDNARWAKGAIVGKVGPQSLDPRSLLKHHPGVTPENIERLGHAVDDAMHIGQQQAKRGNVFSKKTAPDPLLFGAETAEQTAFHGDYLPRTYTGEHENDIINGILGRGRQGGMAGANPIAKKTLHEAEDIGGFLGENPKLQYERNAVTRLAKRAEAQGVLAQRAEIGKAILGDGYQHADSVMRENVAKTIKDMAKESPEDARALMDAFAGIGPRSKPMEWLATANRYFKPAAVYGAFLPKVGSIVRNRVSGIWQGLSNPESRDSILAKGITGNAKSFGSDLADAFTQVFKPGKLKTGELTDALTAIDSAYAQSGGLADHAMQILERSGRKDLADVLRSGAMDGFVSSEDLIKEMTAKPWKKNFGNMMNWPGKVFKGVEDRMRLGMALDLQKSGKSASEAGRITRETFFDYSVSSGDNRAARDLIPFGQFMFKAIPQQAKLLAEKPLVAGGLSRSLVGANDEELYPYLEGRVNVPLGDDEEGNAQYASGLGLPFESLNMIPSSFRDIERSGVGSASPPLKSLFGAISGEDPFFESPFGSYSKMPIVGEAGAVGRAYNILAGSGMIQPLDSPLRLIDKAIDDRKSPAMKALDILTGANVVSVDPDRALQQQLTQDLKANPNIRQYRGFYSDSDDDATDALLKKYQAAKARLKAKRAAE
jgi:hypothetical protein